MIRSPVEDWQELSALYERADELDDASLAAWLDQLAAEDEPLLPQLRRMLAARSVVRDADFLGSMPPLSEIDSPLSPHRIEADVRIGPYRLLRHIGRGGMAEVWLARRDDGAFERQVAIKLLFRHTSSTERDTFAQRFARERDIVASLHHPNIAGLHDAGVTAEGQPWLALEYVEGEPITAWCDRRRLDVPARVRLFRQVLLAVQHAHANLVIHRDLKPANILVTDGGEVRLLDFGIAKLQEVGGGALEETELTRQSGRPLTLHYASPEQVMGRPLSTACDVYSLGVVLYELLCGERPYETAIESAAQVERSILEAEPRAPSRRCVADAAASARHTTPKALSRALAPDLDAIVEKCLRKQPAARYATVEALRLDLENWCVGKPVNAKSTGVAERAWKFCLRHRLVVSSTAAATLALLVLAVVALFMSMRARDESGRAVAARDFLVEMFRVADPDRSQGAEPTARQILEMASDRAMVDLKDQPDLLASVLDIVSQMQNNMGLFTAADKSFSRLTALYQRLGKQREFVLAQTAYALNAYRLGDDRRASMLIAVAAKSAAPFEHDHLLQTRLVLVQGWILRSLGKLPEAREAMKTALTQSTVAFGPNHYQTIEAIRGLAEVEGEFRNYDFALELLADAMARSTGEPSVDARYRLETAIARANAMVKAGRYKDAADVAVGLVPECERLSGKRNDDCAFLRRLLAVALLRSQAPESALVLIDDLLVASSNESAPVLQVVSLMTSVRVLAENRQLGAHADLIRRLSDYAGDVDKPLVHRVQACLTLAEAAVLGAAPEDEARQWAERARALLLAEGSSVNQRGRVEVMLAVSLASRGQHEAALSMLERADVDHAKEIGVDHPLRFLYGMNRASVLHRLGRDTEAASVADAALPALRKAFGISSPAVRRIEELRKDWLTPGNAHSESARPADVFF